MAMKYNETSVRVAKIQNTENINNGKAGVGDTKWYSQFGRQFDGFL